LDSVRIIEQDINLFTVQLLMFLENYQNSSNL